MRPVRPAFVLAALIALPALPSLADNPPAPAKPGKALCVFKTVQALPDGDGTMDPAINMLREDLKRPPFTAWKTFKMLGRQEQELAEGATANYSTPDGRTASLTYSGHSVREGKHAIRVVFDIHGAGKSNAHTTLTLDEGGHFVVAGHKHQGGILIYAVSCKTEQ